MWQHIVTAEGVGARYRRDEQQYLLILMHTYGTRFIKWCKNEGGSKILNWWRGTFVFCVHLCCVNELEYFWTIISYCLLRLSSALLLLENAAIYASSSPITCKDSFLIVLMIANSTFKIIFNQIRSLKTPSKVSWNNCVREQHKRIN